MILYMSIRWAPDISKAFRLYRSLNSRPRNSGGFVSFRVGGGFPLISRLVKTNVKSILLLQMDNMFVLPKVTKNKNIPHNFVIIPILKWSPSTITISSHHHNLGRRLNLCTWPLMDTSQHWLVLGTPRWPLFNQYSIIIIAYWCSNLSPALQDTVHVRYGVWSDWSRGQL